MKGRTRVDLEAKTIRLRNKEYQWQMIEGDDGEERRRWYRIDRSVYVDPYGQRIAPSDIGEAYATGSEEWEALRPLRLRVRDPEKRRCLRKALREARSELRKKTDRKAQDSKQANVSEPGATQLRQPREDSEKESRVKTVSVRLKSETSGFELNLRAAPSKKQKSLYNFAANSGSRLLGYVEVPVAQIIDLGRELQKLETSGAEDSEGPANSENSD